MTFWHASLEKLRRRNIIHHLTLTKNFAKELQQSGWRRKTPKWDVKHVLFFCFSWKSWEYVWYYVKWSKIGSCQVEKQIFYLLINECNLQTVPKGGLCFHSLQKGNLLPINHTKKSKMFTLSIQYFCNTHSLCSRNFQNEKLRLDFVEIW